jgi:hypothetical protein
MRKRKFNISGLFIALLAVLLVTCEKNKEEEVDPLIGTYTFDSATFNDTVKIKVPVFGNITIMPGTSAKEFVEEGLLGAAPCDNSDSAAVELKSDGKILYACRGETNEAQMGTWLINTERTILTLNISNPQAFGLTVSDLTITANSFSGTVENFPLPLDANFELGANLPESSIPNIQFKSVDLAFMKVP